MTTYHEWFKTIAFALNDDEPNHEFARYPLARMLAAYNAALCIVYKFRLDLFTEWKVVKLQAGRYQDMRGCCDQTLSVADQVTADGATVKELVGDRKTETTVKRHWRKPSCLVRTNAPGGYVIDNVNVDAKMNGRFTVDPPVPEDVDAYVRVKCVKGPCELLEAELNKRVDPNCVTTAAAWHFVLARMLTGDRFAQTANNDMQYHYRMFFEILGIVLRQEEIIEHVSEARP